MGTLVVWLDDGVANDEPLLAVPINLSILLDLPQDQVRALWMEGIRRGGAAVFVLHDFLSNA